MPRRLQEGIPRGFEVKKFTRKLMLIMLRS